MIDSYQRPTIEELVSLVLIGGYESGDHIDQLYIPEIAKKLNIQTNKNRHIYYGQLGKKKIIKIALLCFEELLQVAKNKGLIKNNYECSLRFILNPMFFYYDSSYQKIEDISDCATIIKTEQDIFIPNNIESFTNEFDKYYPPELFFTEGGLDDVTKECDLSYLDIEQYMDGYPYSTMCYTDKEETDCGIYYNRTIMISV